MIQSITESDSLIFVLRTSNINFPSVFIEVNDLAYKTLGYTKNELLDMTFYDLIVEEDRTLVDAINNELPEDIAVEYEITCRKKDGTKIKLAVESIVFYSGTCKIEFAVAKVIEIVY